MYQIKRAHSSVFWYRFSCFLWVFFEQLRDYEACDVLFELFFVIILSIFALTSLARCCLSSCSFILASYRVLCPPCPVKSVPDRMPLSTISFRKMIIDVLEMGWFRSSLTRSQTSLENKPSPDSHSTLRDWSCQSLKNMSRSFLERSILQFTDSHFNIKVFIKYYSYSNHIGLLYL